MTEMLLAVNLTFLAWCVLEVILETVARPSSQDSGGEEQHLSQLSTLLSSPLLSFTK